MKRKKQAEFLVHARFPWKLVERIAVSDRVIAKKVVDLLAGVQHQPRVTIEPKWYYN